MFEPNAKTTRMIRPDRSDRAGGGEWEADLEFPYGAVTGEQETPPRWRWRARAAIAARILWPALGFPR